MLLIPNLIWDLGFLYKLGPDFRQDEEENFQLIPYRS